MLANYLIGLREGLEAGLIVSILIAYANKIGRRDLVGRLWVGIAIAVAISLGVGAVLTWGPYALTTQAQEALGGILSLVAVAMVTWMIFWMGKHGATLSKELRGRVDSVADGSWVAIVLLGAVSVGREGVETALFVWASVSSGNDPVVGTLGAVLGILTAVVIAYGISKGLVRFNLGTFFTWTGGFLVLIAAGVFAYAIHDLQEAGLLPAGQAAYSLAGVIQPGSWVDSVLGGIFNFTTEPTWAQVIGWTLYVVVVLSLYIVTVRRRSRAHAAAIAAKATDGAGPGPSTGSVAHAH